MKAFCMISGVAALSEQEMVSADDANYKEFLRADKNEDGFLNVEELVAAFQLDATHDLSDDEKTEFFDKMDEDLDGKVSHIEYRDPMRSFTVLLRKQFEHLDIGNDGVVDENELTIGLQYDKMAVCDADADGTIVLTEFIEGSLRTLFPDDFVQGDVTEIGVDKEGQPLPQVREVPAPEGLRYAAAVVARDAHIYDPYVKFQDMKRTQASLRDVMGEMNEIVKGMGGSEGMDGAAGADPFGIGEIPEGMDLTMLQQMFAMGAGEAPPMGDTAAAQSSIDEVLNSFDNEQVSKDARRLFGRPSLRELMAEGSSGSMRHVEL